LSAKDPWCFKYNHHKQYNIDCSSTQNNSKRDQTNILRNKE
jgi:hypothetical protein